MRIFNKEIDHLVLKNSILPITLYNIAKVFNIGSFSTFLPGMKTFFKKIFIYLKERKVVRFLETTVVR